MLHNNVVGNLIKPILYFYTPKTAESQTQTLNGYLVLPKQDFSWSCLSMKAISPFSDLMLVNS